MGIWDIKCAWNITWLQDTVKFQDVYNKGMLNDYWVVWVFGIRSVFGVYYGHIVLQDFRMFIGKWMLNGYWIVWLFGTVNVFGIQDGYRIL